MCVAKAVCDYGAGGMATETTKSAVKLWAEAYKTSHMLFIKEVELTGLTDTTKNGLRGLVRGYVANSGIGVMYLLDTKRKVSIKSETPDSLVWTVTTTTTTTTATTPVATALMQRTQREIFVTSSVDSARPVRWKRCHCERTTVPRRRPIS
jgi:hypothetical protein